ncbi:MAG: hypothetical protein RLZ86_1769, partial [Actinomycetota bacterium]
MFRSSGEQVADRRRSYLLFITVVNPCPPKGESMKFKSLAAVAAASILIAACGGDDGGSSSNETSAPAETNAPAETSAPAVELSGTLIGAGASSQKAAMQSWQA